MNICECDNSLNSKRSWDSRCSTSKTYTGRSHFIALLFLCFTDFVCKLKARSSPSKDYDWNYCNTCFSVVAWNWNTATPRHTCAAVDGFNATQAGKLRLTTCPLLNATASKETQWKPAIKQPWAQGLSFLTGSSVLTLTGVTHSHWASVLGSGYLEAQPEKAIWV